MNRLYIFGFWVLALLAAAGCRSAKQGPPKEFGPPAATIDVEHFSGSPFSGPTTRPVSAPPPDHAWHVKVALLAFERPAPATGEPIGARARLVAATRGIAPVMPSSRLTRDTRWIDLQPQADVAALLGPVAGRNAPMRQFDAAMIPGVTLGVEVADPVTRPDPVSGTIPKRRVEFRLYRGGGGTAAPASGELQVGLVVEDFVTPPAPAEPVDDRPAANAPPPELPPPVFTREIVVIDRDPVAGGTDQFAIALPIQFEGAVAQCIVAVVEVSPGTDTPEHRKAIDAALAGVARSAQVASARPTTAPVGIDTTSTFNAALAALTDPIRRRSALVFLAGTTRAALCEDVALVADDATLGEVCTEIGVKTAAATAPWSADTLGWLLESTAFQLLGKRLSESRIAPELSAVLTTYAGQAGRSAASIEELSKGLGSRQAFENRLYAENLLFLEDGQPAARVRAFDWLKSRGRAPAAFDPLGPPRERRAALEKAFATPVAAPANPPTTAPAGGRP
jgi:hypothetical protein